jgi:hypothetical protein
MIDKYVTTCMERRTEVITRFVKPWARYTGTQTALNGIIIATENADMLTGLEDAVTNLPFLGGVNIFYTRTVDWIIEHMSRPRLASNAFSLLVSAGFYSYALATNDSDPTLPSSVAAGIGLYLTNKHVTERIENER